MRVVKTEDAFGNDNFFAVVATTDNSQIAIMTLQPGEVSGPYGTDHSNSDQILVVLQGEAVLTVEGNRFQGAVGDIFLIEAGEKHQISVTGEGAMKSLNIYSPPAYDGGDLELKAPS